MATTKITERINSNFEDTSLYQFLGAEDATRFKNQVIDIILEQIKNDLENSHYYCITLEDIQEMVESIKDDIKKEVMEEVGSQIKNTLKETIYKELLNI